MPRLTQIKETKKGRLALFFDGEFAFSLDENTFADAGLHQDDDLEEWQIEELRKKSETRRALDKAMDYRLSSDTFGYHCDIQAFTCRVDSRSCTGRSTSDVYKRQVLADGNIVINYYYNNQASSLL